MKDFYRRFIALAIVFTIAFLVVYAARTALGGRGLFHLFKGSTAQQHLPETYTLPKEALFSGDNALSALERISKESSDLTQAVLPSVVSIDTAGTSNEHVRDRYGRTFIRKKSTSGEGSGIIVSKEGHIVTNHHVIANKDSVKVTLNNGKKYLATLIGEDPSLDIAVLKLRSNDTFTPLSFGDSDKALVGELVFAIGNPFGYEGTVTQGIISAKERSLSESQRDLLQISAAINPGNSGGPLVDIRGQIIGINSAIFSSDSKNPGFQGIGFAIPANDVKRTLSDILERGKPIRGYLGVAMQDLSKELRALLEYSHNGGAVIEFIRPESPAEKAKLKENDIITEFNGQTVENLRHMIQLVHRSKIDTPIPLTLWREGAIMKLDISLSENPNDYNPQMPAPTNNQDIAEAIGIEVRGLSIRDQIRGLRGVVVDGILNSSAAHHLVKQGDVIYKVNGNLVRSRNEFFYYLLQTATSVPTTLHIYRDGKHLEPIDIPAVGIQ